MAHFLNKPVNLDLLYEILEVYVRGGKKHDVLLIEDYNPLQNGLGEKLKEKRHSVFIVHDPRAAKNYLRKNKARAVLVHKDNDEFVSLRPQLDNEKVFRVENENNLVEVLLNLPFSLVYGQTMCFCRGILYFLFLINSLKHIIIMLSEASESISVATYSGAILPVLPRFEATAAMSSHKAR